LLHSGARYADVDPESAVACAEENRILRRIAGAAIEPTGGYFLELSEDDDSYFERKLTACQDCGIEATVFEGDELRCLEPDISDDLVRAIEVPDAVVYPSRLVAATAASAREHGATILSDSAVTDIELGRTVTVRTNGNGSVTADPAVNAGGAWAGRIAGLAGVEVTMAPTRGLMIRLEYRGLGSVLNRCRPPSDGDIVVPHADSVVCGTTSEPVGDPDDTEGDPADVEIVQREAATMVPSLAGAPVTQSFWGVRPLFSGGGRAASRGFQVLDHETRDGVSGMTTVVGGKLTTYRLMAEEVGDCVAKRLGIDTPSVTDEEALPGRDDPDHMDAIARGFEAIGPGDTATIDGA
jgi:glycerol-3-phosphate dehydrogenase